MTPYGSVTMVTIPINIKYGSVTMVTVPNMEVIGSVVIRLTLIVSFHIPGCGN